MPDTIDAHARSRRRQQLPDEAATYVRELIYSGSVRPGEFLRLEPIAEAVGVSKTPVREGLLALRGEGLIRLVPRRGFVVAPFSRNDIRDLFWAQARLGGELAARTARLRTPVVLANLDALAHLHDEAYAAGRTNEEARLGQLFHREINLAADSHRLAALMGSIYSQLPTRFYAAIDGRLAETRVQHPPILEALRAGNAHQARLLMYRHIIDGADGLINGLEHRGMWAE